MSFLIYKKLGLGAPNTNVMFLLLDDRIVKILIEVLQDFLVKVKSFIFPVDFVMLDCGVGFKVPINIGRPFFLLGIH